MTPPMATEQTLARALAAPIPGILDLLGQSGPMALFVLGLLAVLSIVSWAIMIDRWRRFRFAEREDRALLERMRSDAPAIAADFSRHMAHGPLSALFAAFHDELDRRRAGEEGAGGAAHGAPDPRLRAAVERRIEKSALGQTRRFQRFLGFLATTATVAPFIGLFGTVWGIMNAFRSIGAAGGASIAAYAPGIAEALVTTAAGLAAAIPAVAGYNYFVARVRHLEEEMDDFSADLLQKLDSPRR